MRWLKRGSTAEAQLQITYIGIGRLRVERIVIQFQGVPMVQYTICLIWFSLHFARRFNHKG